MGKAYGHPLDPITAEEISLAAAACKEKATALGISSLRFNTITLQEPAKQTLIAWQHAGCPADALPPREAFCILQTPTAVEALVRLSGGPSKVISWAEMEGVQPLATPEDCELAEALAKADPEVQRILSEVYGIEDIAMVACDPWSVHLPPMAGRLIQTFMYQRGGSLDDNHYAHPLDFVPIVDLDKGKVVRIDRPYGDSPPQIPSTNMNYHRDLCEVPFRSDIKPLDIVQPQGACWTIEGNLIKWQRWQIRMSFNYREGLVLHDVAYDDAGKLRPIVHRMSLVEMAVPYADPNEPYTRKCAFDVGDYGLGNCTNSLELGCDCLGNIHYFDAVLNNSKGEPVALKKAVCMHEEDSGIMWKHLEYRTGHAEVRRSRRLVLSFICTVVNYEYAFYYYFAQDGTISYEIKLTGELSTNLVSPGENPAAPDWGTLVAPGVNAQYHQHMFSMRIDPAVDDAQGGAGLVVAEVDAVAVPEGPDNTAGNAFTVLETDLLTESEAQRVCNASSGRYWKIKNPASRHPATGKPVAYKLMPMAGPLLLAAPSSGIAKRGAFATKALWVTPHQDLERWPAGDYPMQHAGGDGLAKWTAANRSLAGADPVIWHTFGATHVPRPEDFPVMPCEVVGFMLKPFGFFEYNPARDLPPGSNKASMLANGSCCANGSANGSANGTTNRTANGTANGTAH
ncbi:hypothetical protein D9Q98_010082 [Chlorella vulgaris]|uniref:Amine oxidase n=1 Tax=Chlorella vulgaris TaxID=3077 RepID=A0A9D4TMN9_CHLVU|nr:hypothetical protein D9Q98_010082 [Chlorella vulgaris]